MLGKELAYEHKLGTIYEGIDSIDKTEKKKRSFQFRSLSFVFCILVLDVQFLVLFLAYTII